MRRTTNELLAVNEIIRNFRNRVSCTQHLEVTQAFEKKSNLFENLNDAYVYRCLCLQLGNKVKMERIIMFTRDRESAF